MRPAPTSSDRDQRQTSSSLPQGGQLVPEFSSYSHGSSNSRPRVAQDHTDIFSLISDKSEFLRIDAKRAERQYLLWRFQQDWKFQFLSGQVPEHDQHLGWLSNKDLGALYRRFNFEVELYRKLEDGFEDEVFVESRVVLQDEVPVELPLHLLKTYPPFALNPSKMMAKRQNTAHAEAKADVEVMYAQLATYVETGKKLQAMRGRLVDAGKAVKEAQGPVQSNTSDEEILIHSMRFPTSDITRLI